MNFTLEDHCNKILLEIYFALDGNQINTDFLNSRVSSLKNDLHTYSTNLITDFESSYEKLTEDQKESSYYFLDSLLYQKNLLNDLYKYWSYEKIYYYLDQLENEINMNLRGY